MATDVNGIEFLDGQPIATNGIKTGDVLSFVNGEWINVSIAGFMQTTDKSKLDGIAQGATNYTHPANHPASIITQDSSNRFVTDAEKTAWDAKVTGQQAQQTTPWSGSMVQRAN